MDRQEIEVTEMKSMRSLTGYKLNDQECDTAKQNQQYAILVIKYKTGKKTVMTGLCFCSIDLQAYEK